MATIQTLEASTRQGTAGVVRRAEKIPAVLYGHGINSQSIEVNAKQFMKVLKAAGFSSLVNIKLTDGKEHTVLIRDIQYHPIKSNVIHADFYQVRMDEKIEAKVPLRFIGEASAVKDLGGVFVRNLDALEVSALPADLPHDLEVDISILTDFTKGIRVSDITVPKGVTIGHDGDELIAIVQEPRSEQEIEALATEVKEDVEAVEGVKKEEPVAEGAEGEVKAEDKDKKEKKE